MKRLRARFWHWYVWRFYAVKPPKTHKDDW